VPSARAPLNASVGSEERAGGGRSSSANAATNSATSAGRNAVRYTRTSSKAAPSLLGHSALSSHSDKVMADRAPRILLVDDEPPIQTLLSFPLERDGYEVVAAADGREALARYSEQIFDLVVLDVMLPRMDGLEVCRRLRAKGETVPIIMLTAKSEEIDKVLGLELGADDYITKPFSMREFRSRVKAALRRSGMARADSDDERPIDVRGLRIDPGKRSVSRNGETIPTTYVEFEILAALARSPGRVFTRDMLLARVWGDSSYRDPRTIDVHIRHLREKIEADPKEPEYLFTVRGVGYRFRDEDG
jgi:DNA-binding response OmpR family regulator